MSTGPTAGSPAPLEGAGARPFIPEDSWPMPARQLIALTAEVAAARRRATTASAEAYLAAEGTQYARAAAADLAAAAAREDLEKLEGRAEAWRWVLSQTGPPEPESAGPAMPRPPEPDASWPRYARDV